MQYYIKYFASVLAHKKAVFVEAWRLGIPLRGLLHDWSKLTPAEWRPRINAMRQGGLCNADGKTDLSLASDELRLCWLKHYHRNSHHWQHWLVHLDDGTSYALPIPDGDRREMLADWIAVSKRPDRLDMLSWYSKNKEFLLLHPDTRRWVEKEIHNK